MQRITKDTRIGDAINMAPDIIPILLGAGMHCIGCPSSIGETIEQAAEVHGIDCDDLLEEIHTFLASQC